MKLRPPLSTKAAPSSSNTLTCTGTSSKPHTFTARRDMSTVATRRMTKANPKKAIPHGERTGSFVLTGPHDGTHDLIGTTAERP